MSIGSEMATRGGRAGGARAHQDAPRSQQAGKIIVRVWFSALGGIVQIESNAGSRKYLKRLRQLNGIYYAPACSDYEALRRFEVGDHHE